MIANDLFLDSYVNKIKNDYADWMTRVCKNDQYGDPAPRIKEFQEGVEMSFGTKYIKITSGGSAHSFMLETKQEVTLKTWIIIQELDGTVSREEDTNRINHNVYYYLQRKYNVSQPAYRTVREEC